MPARPTCFIAMPITTSEREAELYSKDTSHWAHVLDVLFVPAVDAAGFQPIKPVAKGSALIHANIVKQLVEADMVLCDLSGHNPNVFFELGVRTSLNKPIALVKDEHTTLPFDTAGINTHEYDCSMQGWLTGPEVERLTAHVRESATSCDGKNPLWQQFGLTIQAEEPEVPDNPHDAKLDVILQKLQQLDVELPPRLNGAGFAGPPNPSSEVVEIELPMNDKTAMDLPVAAVRFFRDVQVFATEDGRVPRWYWIPSARTAAVSGEALAGLPVLSSRIIREASQKWSIGVLELPS